MVREHPALAGSHDESRNVTTTVAERVIDFFAICKAWIASRA